MDGISRIKWTGSSEYAITGGNAYTTTGQVHTGGGIRILGGSPRLNNLVIEGNTAGLGGGIYNTGGNTHITNCKILRNVAATWGGGIYSQFGEVDLFKGEVQENQAQQGGGIYNHRSNSNISKVIFARNQAERGGAILNRLFSHNIFNTIFVDNRASREGGALMSDEDTTLVVNVLFNANSTQGEGGAVRCSFGKLTVVNSTLVNNKANISGGGFSCNSGQNDVQNTILWKNLADQIHFTPGISDDNFFSIGYSIHEGGLSRNVTDAGANIDADPLFQHELGPDGLPGTIDDDFQLQPNSPAIDFGNNDLLVPDILDLDEDSDTVETVPSDLADRVRIHQSTAAVPIVDMGAYEFGAPFIDVSTNDDQPTRNQSINVYPNPFGPVLNVKIEGRNSAGIGIIRLYNINGQLARTWRGLNLFQGGSFVFETANLPSGLFTLEVRVNNLVQYIPIVHVN